MPTTITTASNANAKVRFREQYVSDGLNKKFNGIVPSGIVRGGRIVTSSVGLSVTIVADSDSGDSIFSYINADGQQITFRVVGNLNLNLAGVASTDVYIALYIDYSVGVDTVVEWRAYTIAELTTAPVAEAPYLVVMGRVNVPAAGPIPASNIIPELRRDAWESRSAGMEPWIQFVENGSWDLAETAVISTSPAPSVVAWEPGSIFTANLTWRIVTTAPRSGARELEILGDGVSVENKVMRGISQASVVAGDLLRVRFYIRGNVWGGIGANGQQGIRLRFLDSDKQFISYAYADDVSLSGTFAYTLIDEIIEAPVGAAFVSYGIYLNTDSATPSGSVFFDDIMIWKQSSQILDENTRQSMGFGSSIVAAAHLVPLKSPFGTSMDDAIEETLKVASAGYTGSVVQIVAQIMGTASHGFDIIDQKMGLKIQRQISDLGGSLLGTDADADLPRIIANHRISKFTLIWESAEVSGSLSKLRLYVYTLAGNPYFVLTTNAKNVNATNNWFRDVPANDSWYYQFGSDRMMYASSISSVGNPFFFFDSSEFRVAETGVDGMQVTVKDGQVRFTSPTTGGTNPTAAVTPVSNTLYGKNIVKAYGRITIVGGAGPIVVDDEGFNILSAVNMGNLGIRVNLRKGFASLSHAVVFAMGDISIGPQAWVAPIYQVFDDSASSFTIIAVSPNSTSAFVDFSDPGFDDTIRFMVLGKQI